MKTGNPEYLLGIDCGTGGVRAAVFDRNGRCLAYDVQGYDTVYPYNGWAEQTEEGWLQALEAAIPACIRKAGICKEDIAAMACDATTNTLVFLDAQDRPVRNPMLWMDVRAAGEAAVIDAMRERFSATEFYKPVFRIYCKAAVCMRRDDQVSVLDADACGRDRPADSDDDGKPKRGLPGRLYDCGVRRRYIPYERRNRAGHGACG